MGRRQSTKDRARDTCNRECDRNDCDHGGQLDCGHWVQWASLNTHHERCGWAWPVNDVKVWGDE